MTGYLKLGILAGCLFIGFIAGWNAKAVLDRAHTAEEVTLALKQLQIKQANDNAVATSAESSLLSLDSKYETILKESYDAKPDSNAGCNLDPRWVRNLNELTADHSPR